MEVGGGFWIKIEAVRIPATSGKPYGVNYSLCLFDPRGQRVVGYDNAHAVSVGRPPSRKKVSPNDHVHGAKSVAPYAYSSAEVLLVDFWNDVDAYLRKANIE
tara:strand:+ start:3945 stop:4250 length:306 start_codon:yes stop_codon:yes gene_type:complete